MIVWCERCNENPIDADPLDGTFQSEMLRPVCKPCLEAAELRQQNRRWHYIGRGYAGHTPSYLFQRDRSDNDNGETWPLWAIPVDHFWPTDDQIQIARDRARLRRTMESIYTTVQAIIEAPSYFG